jgi:hypothetical protein
MSEKIKPISSDKERGIRTEKDRDEAIREWQEKIGGEENADKKPEKNTSEEGGIKTEEERDKAMRAYGKRKSLKIED